MPNICTKCGSPINDGEKFCTSCGTAVEVERVTTNRFCRQCGNLLSPGAKFCDVCGKEAPQEKKKEEPKIEEPATMEGLVSPVITEDTFAAAKELNRERFDGFESAEMPGGAPAAPQTPPPAPSFEMDAAGFGGQQKPQPQPQPAPAPVPQQSRPQVTAQSIQQSNPYAQYGARQTTGSPAPQPAPAPQQQPVQQNVPPMPQSMPQQPMQQNVPPMPQSMPQPDAPKQGKGSAAPAVIAVIIVLILILDALLFFGPLGDKLKDKDSDKGEKDCAQIVLVEETQEIGLDL